MASDQQMREAIKKAYRNRKSWEAKVNKMPSHQVAAIYNRLLSEKKL